MSTDYTFDHLEMQIQGGIKYILPDITGSLMAIQYVQEDSNVLGFYLIDLDSNDIVEELEITNDLDNLVIKSFSKDHLLTIRFSDQNNPDVVDLYNFQWNSSDPTFAKLGSQIKDSQNDWIEIPHPHFQGKTIILDLKTGAPLSEKPQKQDLNEGIYYPTAYTKYSQYFEMLEKLLLHNNITLVKQCEYLKLEQNIILSYYTEEEGELCNYLSIVNNQGMIIESHVLAKNLKGIGKDTFFVSRNKLIFVSNKTDLNVITL